MPYFHYVGPTYRNVENYAYPEAPPHLNLNTVGFSMFLMVFSLCLRFGTWESAVMGECVVLAPRRNWGLG